MLSPGLKIIYYQSAKNRGVTIISVRHNGTSNAEECCLVFAGNRYAERSARRRDAIEDTVILLHFALHWLGKIGGRQRGDS